MFVATCFSDGLVMGCIIGDSLEDVKQKMLKKLFVYFREKITTRRRFEV